MNLWSTSTNYYNAEPNNADAKRTTTTTTTPKNEKKTGLSSNPEGKPTTNPKKNPQQPQADIIVNPKSKRLQNKPTILKRPTPLIIPR
jgi:hypothetical protein